MLLTKRQRNEIFETIAANGLDPQSCTLKDHFSILHSTEAVIRHRASRSHYRITMEGANGYRAHKRVGSAVPMRTSSAAEWNRLMANLADWAREVAYEVQTADFWTELGRLPAVLPASQVVDLGNAPFTPGEQAEVSRRVDQVKDVIRRENPELTAEQTSAIEQTLDEVKEATTRVGRKDWLMMANGALLSLIVNELVPPHVVQGVFHLLISGIGHLFGIGGPPPVISG